MSELEVTLKLRDDLSHEAASAAARFAQTAAESGALDVAYATVDSPFGRLLVAASARGLLRLAYPDEPVAVLMEELAEEVSPRILEAPGRLDPLRRQLEEYFARSRRRFEFPIDWRVVRAGGGLGGYTGGVQRKERLLQLEGGAPR